MYTLYGDGIHDDFPAIQELIDSGVKEVVLPEPKVCYLISKISALTFRVVTIMRNDLTIVCSRICFNNVSKFREIFFNISHWNIFQSVINSMSGSHFIKL